MTNITKHLRYNNICLRALTILCLMMTSVGAWAQQYVFITNEPNGYFLGLNNGNAVATQTFTTGSCVWTASETLNNTNNRTLRIGTSYLDGANSNSGTVSIGTTRNSYWRGNNNQLYYYRNANRAVYRDGTQVKWNGTTNLFRIYTSYSTKAESLVVNPITGIDDVITITSNGSVNLTSTAKYNPEFYAFTGPDTRYYANGYTTGAVTTAPSKESGFSTDSWSVSPSVAGVSIENGQLKYTLHEGGETKITITHTVKEGTKTVSVTRDVTLLYPADPISINASDMELVVGATQPVNPTLTCTIPGYSNIYTNFSYASNNPAVASVNATTGVVTGLAGGQTTVTIKAYKYSAPTQFVSTTITVTVMEKVATPVIEFAPQGEGETASTTITCGTADAKIYYTTDGTTPSASSTLYTGAFNVNNLDVVKAIAVKNGVYFTDSEVASATYSKHKMPTPEITIDGSGVSFSCSEDGASFYYTIDGSTPTTSSTLWNGTPFTPTAAECTIKVIAAKSGSQNSDVAERPYVRGSGVSGGTVVINDYEDHNWTYYQSSENLPAGYPAYLSSPDPRNVKITYRGGSVNNASAVAISGLTGEEQNEMIYYKTLEKTVLGMTGNYPYQVISNPFSKRPRTNGTTGTNGFWGFAGWKIISGGKYIAEHADNDVLGLDEIIHFTNLDENYTPNCKSGEVIFEATWTAATVKTGTTAQTFTGGTYETNFWVLSGNTGSISIGSACTVSARYPDGTSAGNYSIGANNASNITTTVDNAKIEFLNLNTTGTVNAAGYSLTLGRGITWTRYTGQVSLNTGQNRAQTVKIESGAYGGLKHFNTNNITTNGNDQLAQKLYLGCDYDRAKNDNLKLRFNAEMIGSRSSATITASNNHLYEQVFIKSGDFMSTVTTGTPYTGGYAGNGTYYFRGYGNRHRGLCSVTIEGGDFLNICGGTDLNSTTGTARSFHLRVRGNAHIKGVVYGGAENADCHGSRTMIFTGGTINGWVCGAANGTSTSNGNLNGTTYFYIGGNVRVDSEGATRIINKSMGGNVYAAGCGAGGTTSGRVDLGTNLVLADNAYVERGVYGGGAYGYSKTDQTTNIFITGGHLAGKNGATATTDHGGVFGGACQQAGGTINITMTGGLIEGGLHGGSNTNGTISGNVTMQIDGGQVGSTTTPANVHGGGYGDGTVVSGNVEMTLGNLADERGVKVYGNVYGGAALGTTGGNTRHTYVTVNRGSITGDVFGGGMGEAGSNTKGVVTGTIAVNVYGTDPAPDAETYALHGVYGGGDLAPYAGTPTVKVHNCDNSIEYVYGGGNATSVAGTDVTIWGGDKIGNVFGGGNGQVRAANVTGGTSVKIYGGTIGDVYGGSNTNGTIGGTINVNVNAQAEPDHAACPIDIDNVYGGGNKAASAAGNVTIGCAEHIGAVYGGANQANINGNINLSIVSGHIDNVFGGNNTSGNISGTITVTVNDNNSACGMEVRNVYGGGNQAAYTAPATNGSKYPAVNIQNGHLTGSVFGGGLGETAVVTGNPQVTIGQPSAGTVHIDGNVFGGGDAANVVGKPVVLVQNCSTQIGTKDGEGNWNSVGGTVYGGGNAAHVTGAGNGTSVTINGGDINRVFGGGNGEVSPANVEGNAQTVIHAGNIHQAFAGSNMQGNISGSATITVDHSNEGCGELIDEVYGGGNQAAGNAGTVTIDCGANIGDVYGGANQADINSAITLNITGGTINRVFGGNNTSGNISGAITVNVNKKDACDLDLNYVYGAGNQAAYTPSTPGAYPAVNILKGTVKQDVFGGGLGATAIVTSNPTVTVNGGVVSGNVFGGGSEANTVGTTSVTVQAGTVSTDVYGGGALADVEGNTTIAITGGTVTGNAYGGGLGRLADAGAGITAVAAAVTGNTTVNVSGGTTNNVFGCNNFNGGPQGTVNVTISGGTVTNDVYGGGNLAAASANPIVTINGGTMQDVYGGGLGEPAVITGNTTIIINKTAATMSVNNVFGGGSAANVAGNTAITMTEGTVSNIYGGGEAANVVVGADETGKTVVTMNGGTVSHSIYGGGLGNTTNVATSTTVTANGGTVTEDVYGGSGFGKVGATTVTINNGATVTRDVFGGGFGQNADAGAGKEAYEADVTGNASVTINKGAVINGNVYGGNNTNGSPKGTITVLVDGPVDATEKTATPLNLNDVFGGGKNAATTSTGAPEVTIRGCETVIARVFGGGDAAPAPATNVTIWGGHITSAFAGGNGEVKAADIVGDVTITIKGGSITNVFGGSNTAGNIGGAVNVVVDKDPAACDLDVTNLFGGGNLAPGKGGTLTIACTGDGKIDNVYGGANQADVEGDVTLVINGGNIGNAFGGNNQSGTINGAIKVVIDWDGACGINNLDNVYGGGNLAPYTTPDGMVGPTVQLINATINNNVYGGGLGAPAKVTGNPIVTLEGATVGTPETIAAGTGGSIFGGGDAAPVEGNPTVTAMYGSAAKIFAGGKGATAVVTGNPTAVLNKTDEQTLTVTEIYGGGDAAEVTGNTTVTLTKGTITNAFGGGNAAAINGKTLVTIANATASNVYGGGNLAGVTETATINMTGGNVTTGLYGGCNSEGTVTGNIAVNVTGGQVGTDALNKANVHGGGYGSATQTAGNVAVAVNGAGVVVFGDIYGGSALGNVNDNTDDNTTVTITAGTVNGDVYGGGLGDADNAALVNGNVAVNINGGTVTGNVFGCNNVNGTPKGSVAVTVAADANATLAEVYGGGNMATYSPTTAQAPVVTILGCGNTIGYVYGGGNAADVPATNVTVWGGTIGNVFGGGHGDKDAIDGEGNPAPTAANVTGNVTVNIKGGTITNVFAGSNSKGNIGGTVALTIDKDGDCPMHITDVYGGGNQAAGNAGQVTIGCTGGADEGIQNVYGGANAADINSNIALVITGGTINNVFGGNNSNGNISGTIDVTVDWNGSCTTNHINNVYGAGNQAAYTGSPAVKIYNGTVSQNVFGGGLGATAVVTGNPVVTIGDATAPAKVATVGGDVYGGGDAAAVVGTTHVNVIAKENTTINNVYGGGNAADVNGTDVNIDGGNITGMVFGGGHGNASSSIAANVNGSVSVDVTGGTINKVFGGSNDMGNISGTVNVNINKGDDSDEMHITEVYGGGNVAAGNAGTVTIGCTGGATEGIGTVYGGANNANVGNAIVLNISGGSIDNVFGGNNNGGAVAGSITVNVNWTGACGTNKLGNVYGAGNIASYTGNPTVNITNCTTTGSVFGGGKGKPAVVVGNPTVNIGSWTAGAVSIGGNVFGGGDLAAVEGAPTVTIRDCNTFIGGDLYGGGNAAPVFETNTTVWGGTIAGNLFGGGNGVNLDPVTGNPKGAQVGYQRDDTATGGSGNANTYLYGGTIGVWNGNTCESGGGVFGGSNSNGNIRGNVNLNVDERKCGETGATQCPLKIKEIYGAGNEAAYVGTGIDFNLGCVSFLGEIYGGAKAADLNADAILTITSGTFGKVFGGNNVSGKLNGKIVVTIDETGCNPVIIDELYGGGNLAAYSVYGYEDALVDGKVVVNATGTKLYEDPQVNIISCTRIGTVFGGGYGESAVMVGNPTVNINQILGDHASAIDNKLGAIGTVYGGGNAAKVIGDTNVNVGTLAQNAHLTGDTTPTAAGANITGNVYGGGNQADVTGKTNVTVGR